MINKFVVCKQILTFSSVFKKVERDILAIGTPTTLLAYDVENNSDLFYKEVILILFLLLSNVDDGSFT